MHPPRTVGAQPSGCRTRPRRSPGRRSRPLFDEGRARPAAAWLRRTLDVALAAALLVALAPLLLIVALLVKLADGGPVLHWQRRIGYRGREFWFPKFRSMRVGAEALQDVLRDCADHPGSLTFKMRRDPRLTRIGGPLRRLSVDELPQLWCVLRGEMSLVGPRPALPHEVAQYSAIARRRLAVKPGLTCIWQVSGRSELAFPSQLTLDLLYVQHRRLGLDLKLLWLTVPAVLSRRGAY